MCNYNPDKSHLANIYNFIDIVNNEKSLRLIMDKVESKLKQLERSRHYLTRKQSNNEKDQELIREQAIINEQEITREQAIRKEQERMIEQERMARQVRMLNQLKINNQLKMSSQLNNRQESNMTKEAINNQRTKVLNNLKKIQLANKNNMETQPKRKYLPPSSTRTTLKKRNTSTSEWGENDENEEEEDEEEREEREEMNREGRNREGRKEAVRIEQYNEENDDDDCEITMLCFYCKNNGKVGKKIFGCEECQRLCCMVHLTSDKGRNICPKC